MTFFIIIIVIVDRIAPRTVRQLAMLIYLELGVERQSRGIDVRTDMVNPGGTRATTRSLPIWTLGSAVSCCAGHYVVAY